MKRCIFFFASALLIFRNVVYADYDDAMERIAVANMGLSGRYLYRHYEKYPNQSYTVVSLPAYCILSQLALHAEGEDYDRLMEFLNLEDKDEIKQMIPQLLSYLTYDTETLFKLTFRMYSDRKEFTEVFKQDFADICNGDSEYLDYSNPVNAVNEVKKWFAAQSSYAPRTVTRPDMFQNDKGILYTTSMEFISNFDHVYNPNGLIAIDFYSTETELMIAPSLYGNGLVRYVELSSLDAKFIEIILKGGDLSVVFAYPNNPKNLLDLLYEIQDPYVFYGALNQAEWMCLKIHITIGHCHVANDLTEFLPELNLNSTYFHDVFKSDEPAQVNNILQQLHLFADTEVRPGQRDSEFCPGHHWPFVKMNHPCSYYVLTSVGLPVYSGVIYGPQDYGNE